MSNVKASLRSIEALEKWFKQAGKPFWSVWTGFSKDTKDLALRNSSIDDMEESWNLLEQIVSDKTAGGGRVTVFVTEIKNSSAGFTEYLEISASQQAAVSGSSAYGFIGGVDQYIHDKLALYDKDRQIEDLKAQLEAKDQGTGINKIVNRVLEEAPIAELIMALAAKFLGPAAIPTPAVNGAPRITDDLEEEELSEADQAKLHDAIMRISVHFPNVADAMQKLATFIEKNPVMAKSLLSQI